jgi:hypothetical protein
VRRTVQHVLSGAAEQPGKALSVRDVLRFHLPLAATSLLTLLAQPIVGAALARMPHPEETLAAWPVIWGIMSLFRSAAFALPEAVIALVSDNRLKTAVGTFCRRTGFAASAAMLLTVLTPLSDVYLRHVAGLPGQLSAYVIPGLVLGLALPYINAVHSWLRGLLMAGHATGAVYWGMGLNLALTAILVVGGVLLGTPGIATAMIAMTVAYVAEVYYLRRSEVRLRTDHEPAVIKQGGGPRV